MNHHKQRNEVPVTARQDQLELLSYLLHFDKLCNDDGAPPTRASKPGRGGEGGAGKNPDRRLSGNDRPWLTDGLVRRDACRGSFWVVGHPDHDQHLAAL